MRLELESLGSLKFFGSESRIPDATSGLSLKNFVAYKKVIETELNAWRSQIELLYEQEPRLRFLSDIALGRFISSLAGIDRNQLSQEDSYRAIMPFLYCMFPEQSEIAL